jgi:hypothetical protein
MRACLLREAETMSIENFRSRCRAAAVALAVTATLGTLVTVHTPGVANADVCVNAGRRVSVSGCANLADVMAPYVPPPAYYAPMPEDYPPPPPPPYVNACATVNGRHVSVSGCR